MKMESYAAIKEENARLKEELEDIKRQRDAIVVLNSMWMEKYRKMQDELNQKKHGFRI